MLQKLFVADLDPERLGRSRSRNGNGRNASDRNGNSDGGTPSETSTARGAS